MVQKASQKRTKRQLQTVISDFGRALVRVLSPSPWSWLPTAAWGAGCRPKGIQMRWSIRLKWHTGLTSEALLAHRSASSTPLTLEPSTAGIIFGHQSMACIHPCALVSGVGPCLHLCELCKMEHRIWCMHYGIGIQYGKWDVECGTWTIQYGAPCKDCRIWRAWGMQYEAWSTD